MRFPKSHYLYQNRYSMNITSILRSIPKPLFSMSIDQMILCCMMMIGIGGFSFLLHSNFDQPTVALSNLPVDNITRTGLASQMITLTEIQRCDEKNRVTIKLKSKDIKDNILIDFGDGKKSAIDQSDFTYEYEKHGKYVLSVIKKDAFKETVVEKKSINFFPI